ncbi:MAG: SRPBCC domain-containing protein [Cyclobacteriaceae bacterium]
MNETKFTEKLESNQLIGVRTFNAPVAKVWKAWSDPEILCQWWAPSPYVCDIKAMDFREDGHWIYTMTGPEGDIHRGRMDFLKMEENKMFEAEEYFCDENGEKAGDIPPMHLSVIFEDNGENTIITSTTTFASPEAFKQMAEMGAAEGLDIAFSQLEELLA